MGRERRSTSEPWKRRLPSAGPPIPSSGENVVVASKRMAIWTIAAIGWLVIPACSSASTSTAGDQRIAIHGSVTSLLTPVARGFACADAAGKRIRLTFRDQGNSVIGVTQSSPSTVDPTPPLNEGLGTSSCSFVSAYRVVLPRAESYSVSSTSLRAGPESYEDLASRGFEWDLTFAVSP
jgi:hypothetical protein